MKYTATVGPAIVLKPPILLLGIVLLGGLLRFYSIGSKTIWLDEAFSIWTAQHSIPDMIGWLIKIDQHPPLYYLLLHGWQRFFGDLQGAVRSLSALCGTLAIPFVYLATRQIGDKNSGLIAALLLAVSPFHVRFGQEARMYALLTLAVAVALFCLARLLTEEDGSPSVRWPWVGLGVAQAAVMLTHNTATVYFPVALNLALLGALMLQRGRPSSWPGMNRPGFRRRWLLTQGLALLLWLPWAYPYVIQALGVDREFWLWPPTAAMVWETIHHFNMAFIPGWFPWLPLWDALYVGLALLGVVWLWRTPARASLLLCLWLIPPIIALLVSLRRPIFYDRTLIWTTLPYYVLMAIGIGGLGRVRVANSGAIRRTTLWTSIQTIVLALIFVLIFVLSSVSIYTYYVHFQKEEWAKAADYVARRMEPGDMIVFNATWVQLPFEYYLRHYDVDAQLKGLPVDLFDRGVLEPKMTQADLPAMQQLIVGQPRIWLVYSHDWYTDPQQIIPRELNQQMHQVDQQTFVGLKVMKFEQRRNQ